MICIAEGCLVTRMTLAPLVRSYYRETSKFIDETFNRRPIGFKILNGPPRECPPLAIVGIQPGGPVACTSQNSIWPSKLELLDADYCLARKLRKLVANDILAQSIGLNVIFVRSKCAGDYNRNFTTYERRQILQFCKPRALSILEVAKPKRILFIGLGTPRLLGAELLSSHQNDRGRVLARHVAVGGEEALAVLHLTGAHIAYTDKQRIADLIGKWMGSGAPDRNM